MKSLRYLIPIVTVIAMFASSCTKTEELKDEEAIEELINSTYRTELDFENEYADSGLISDTFDISQAKALHRVIGWWRRIISVSSNKEILIENDTAWVNINHHIYGLFNIVYYDQTGDSVFSHNKNFHDLATRKALFVREGDINDPHRGWVLKQVSFGEVTSKDVPDSILIGDSFVQVTQNHIDSIKITYVDTLDNTVTRVFTNYLDLMELEEIPTIKSGTDLTFDLYANDSTNFAFFYRGAAWGTPRRMRMTRDPQNPSHFYTTVQVPSNVVRGSFALSIISAPSFRPDNYPYVHHGVLLRVRVR
ncbi:MAG: hypothetical protein QMD82_01160 [bacterium]|nr:hypothetical protein [bacterium]